ncbi:hypothetical protein [Paenibacillus ihumii]|uniref:hypothetical protein n=1 Tax=Paenibacillus ihumii TaxID=687436 RepID=UPI0006D7EB1E|nr:hypothetical protein [Paenibacillus ihumii]
MYFRFKQEVVLTKGRDNSILSNLITGRKIYLDSADARMAEALYNSDQFGPVPPDARSLAAYLTEQGFGQYDDRSFYARKSRQAVSQHFL